MQSLSVPSAILQLVVSFRKELINLSDTLITVAASMDISGLSGSGGQQGLYSWVHRTVTKGERILKELPLPGQSKMQHTQEPSLLKKPISLPSQLQSEGQKFLIKHRSKGNPFQRPQRVGASSYCLSAVLQSPRISWRGIFMYVWCPGFYIRSPGFTGCHPGDT